MKNLSTRFIQESYRRIAPYIFQTPLMHEPRLSRRIVGEVYLKLECEQKTGSFKIRGALNRMLTLTPAERRCGVVVASAGNHALGIAFAAQVLKIPTTIFLPTTAARYKIAALRRYPITLKLVGRVFEDAEQRARAWARTTGAVYVSPYNDRYVMGGGGTIGYEILRDLPHPNAIIVPVGGGGLISGIGSYIKAQRSKTRMYGAQAAASPTMQRSRRAGEIVHVQVAPTLADGLAGNLDPQTATLALCRQFTDDIFLVSEAAIRRAILWSMFEIHKIIEGSAATGIAALLKHRTHFHGQRVVIVVTGSNIDLRKVLG